MEFDEDAKLDTSQVDDQRSRGRVLSSVPGGGYGVGGGLGIVVLVIGLLLGVNPLDNDASSPSGDPESQRNLAAECRTGADANTQEDCRIVGVVNSVQKFWETEFNEAGERYEPADTRIFTAQINSGCGLASSDVGPFYCPTDQRVYLDLGFFTELRTRFGATGGPFAQAYVVAHEYGHHVQDLLGTMGRVRQGVSGPTSESVRLELQADCYAGLWANGAVATGYIKQLTDADIADGLDAAAAVGDDRIQASVQGRVDPEAWTHGSSAERQRWFTTGYRSGRREDCDTFAASRL
jgi:predicted metalloprotease